MYTVFAVETVTGRNIGQIPCVIQNWARELNGTDNAQVIMYPAEGMGGLNVKTRDYFRLITTRVRSSLVIDWDGLVVYAGPIWNREYNDKSGSPGLTLSSTGITSILAKRKVHTWATPYATEEISYAGQSLGATAINLVQVATSNTKPGASLPFVLPTGETDTDPTVDQTYYGYSLTNVSDALAALTSSLNGPDIDFLPQWVDSSRQYLQYRMRVGTLEQPELFSPQSIAFDAAQPQASVQSIDEVEDSTLLATTQWGKGSGSDVDTLIAQAQSSQLVDDLWPLLEQETDYTSVLDLPTLQANVNADLAAQSGGTDQYTLYVDATRPPVLGSYLLGDQARVRFKGHVWVPDGETTMRIIEIQGDNSNTVQLDMQALADVP
jgi:hypothetical protein